MRNAICLLCLVATSAGAQDAAPQHALRANGDYAEPNGIWRTAVNSGKIPINKEYRDLTDEQKAMLRSSYPAMAPEDEPPYPKGGTETILRPLLTAQRLVYGQGLLKLIVAVDAQGKAQSVRAEGTPGKQIVDFASKLMFVTEFKPAICSGVPCARDYYFSAKLVRE